jgi:hypothetical protein
VRFQYPENISFAFLDNFFDSRVTREGTARDRMTGEAAGDAARKEIFENHEKRLHPEKAAL